jgi:DNA polymerase IV
MSRSIPSGSEAQQSKGDADKGSTTLSLSSLSPVYVLSAHLTLPEFHELQEKISKLGAPLTSNMTEAKIVIGKVETKRRAEFELRCRGLWTEDIIKEVAAKGGDALSRKRRRIETLRDITDKPFTSVDDSSTESEDKGRPVRPQSITQEDSRPPEQGAPKTIEVNSSVKVLSLRWLHDSLEAGEALPMGRYTVYEGCPKERPAGSVTPLQAVDSGKARVSSSPPTPSRTEPSARVGVAKAILERAEADTQSSGKHQRSDTSLFTSKFRPRARTSYGSSAGKDSMTRSPKLLRRTTSEHEESISSYLPEMPSWVKENKKYACERSTPMNSPNRAFIDQLKRIKLSRILTNDDVGVRAYSTSIASLAAYPYPLSNTKEVLALPGCDVKIAHLFHEWKLNGKIQAVEDFENDPAQKVLRLFYDIWGVGANTAREFYYDRGWRDLDDIVEQGWESLSRVQQIGVKYFEEFQKKISRQEVESIAETIAEHARKVRDDGIECCIVGGYRRGKQESGDVDVILTHRDEMQTLGLVMDVVASLETDGWITHTLLIAMGGTKRGQQPIPARHPGGGHGFDTLDKALVVWQDINFPAQSSSQPMGEKEPKNPNLHRRVDIIIAPWRSVGCAIVGWTGATTFERDIRRYAKNVKGWKFDSSGVRVRATGEIVPLEVGEDGEEASTWQEAEKRVFQGLGLEWREPWERCTE